MPPYEKETDEIALEGDLRRFRPEEVLQFIGTSEKTGILEVRAKPMDLEVHFRDGRIVFSRAELRGTHDASGAIFVRTGVVTEENLAYALDLQKRSLKRLGTILVELGYATPTQVGDVLRLQVQEDALKLLKLSEGPFTFRTVAVSEEPYLPPIPVEQMLLDCLRLLDEWPTIAGDLPSFDAVPKLTDQTGELLAHGADNPLERGEMILYELIDGARTLREVIDRSRLGDLEGAKAITALISRGYVVVEQRRGSFSVPGTFLNRAWGFVVATALLGILVGGTWLLGGAPHATPTLPTPGMTLPPLDRARVEDALEAYRLAYGHYPDRIVQLVEDGLLPLSALPEPLRYAGAYVREGDDYRLDPRIESAP